MPIVIVHLSDIHFRADDENPHRDKSARVAHAVKTVTDDAAHIHIAVSGDIAFSGKDKEYGIAERFLTELKKTLLDETTAKHVHFVFAPGNHDCDFSQDSSVRKLILRTRLHETQQEVDAAIIEQCTLIQRPYINFVDRFQSAATDVTQTNLCRSIRVKDDGYVICFQSYNTAWLSQLHERQGTLSFPETELPEPDPEAGLCVAMFHHPYGWLQADNARIFRRFVESNSDVVLTGHEHEFAAYSKHQRTGENIEYLEGAVFQESSKPNRSAFNIVIIDNNQSLQIYKFALQDDLYQADVVDPPAQPFFRNRLRLKGQFELSEFAQEYLDDPGANFTHPYKTKLTLSDIYVIPDFEEITLDTDASKGPEVVIRGNDYYEYLTATRKLLVVGPEQGGKTAFARTVFKELRNSGLVPLLLNGKNINAPKDRKLKRCVRDEVIRQYSEELYQSYLQLPVARRAVIIDDFDQTELNWKGRRELIRNLCSDYDVVILVGSESLRLQELLIPDVDDNPLVAFSNLRMREFGYVLRERLIEKWISIGQEYTADPDDVDHKTVTTAGVVEALIGRGLMPSCPIYILVAVQQIEAHLPLTTASGAYGYFYELLITGALTKNARYLDIDTKYNFLSHLAWWLFKNSTTKLSETELRDIHSTYVIDYKFKFSFDSLVDDLLLHGVLRQTDGCYRIKYRYIMYYFIARYIRDNMGDEKIRKEVSKLMASLYRESHANIIIFLTYLSKDPFIIKEALQKANSLFSEVCPCLLGDDVEFINDLIERIPQVVIEDQEHKQLRQKQLEVLDEASQPENAEFKDDEFKDNYAEQDEAFRKLLEINSAYKTIEVLGQILRNFPGSLKGDRKLEMAEACYMLGLRTIRSTYGLIEQYLEAIVDELSDHWLKLDRRRNKEDMVRRSKAMIYSLCGAVGAAGVLKVSNSVGSNLLEQTYAELKAKHDTNAVHLLDLAIKLDHQRGMPERDVEALDKRLSKNWFASTLLRFLVARRIYLFPMKRESKQRVCEKLGIKLGKKELLLEKSRCS